MLLKFNLQSEYAFDKISGKREESWFSAFPIYFFNLLSSLLLLPFVTFWWILYFVYLTKEERLGFPEYFEGKVQEMFEEQEDLEE